MIDPTCSEKCEADARCTTCDRLKAPIGRSLPLGMYRCDSECPGYRQDPYPPHLWPHEFAELQADASTTGDSQEVPR